MKKNSLRLEFGFFGFLISWRRFSLFLKNLVKDNVRNIMIFFKIIIKNILIFKRFIKRIKKGVFVMKIKIKDFFYDYQNGNYYYFNNYLSSVCQTLYSKTSGWIFLFLNKVLNFLYESLQILNDIYIKYDQKGFFLW